MFLKKFYKADATRFQKASVNFYLISLLAYTIGSPFNMVEYFNRSYVDFILIDLICFVIIYTAFFLYLRDRITIRQNSTIYVYTLLLNLSVSMWLYNFHQFDVTGNILMNVFMYSINMAVAGFCISRWHSFFTAGMFVVINGPLLFISGSLYIREYAPFIIFLMVAYSLALAEFLKILERSFNEEIAFREALFKKDQELAAQKNKVLTMELEEKKKKLMAKAMFLISYAENNSGFIRELGEMRSGLDQHGQNRLDRVIEMHRVDHRRKYWEEFEKSFVEVHQEFYFKLKEKFEGLSGSELKLAALIHLGLSSKQIANLTSNTPESVDVARSRLRNKMGLDVHTNLKDFLAGF